MNESDSTATPKIDLADYFQRFSTRVLWHFTGYDKSPEEAYKILNLILETKTLKLGEKTGKIIMHNRNERFGYQHACLCDIPFRDLRIHMLRYGQFGIAFHKRVAVTNGQFNPVFYVHRNSELFQQSDELLKAIENEVKPDTSLYRNIRHYLLMMGGYVKPGDLTRIIELDSEVDSNQENNFYYEREWRTLKPWVFDDLSIAAILMPQSFLSAFRNHWKDRLAATTIIASEMVETL